jgi:7-carboxy-7-deazaguanine synthase
MEYSKIQPIVELYGPVPQSEGSKAGIPHLVVRTTGCTHRCFFKDGGWCDTWYTSIHPEKGTFNLQDVKMFFHQNKEITHLMLTGGSPTMHPELCNEIINLFNETHPGGQGFVTIETEGSHFIETEYLIDLVSISPKFSNTIPVLGSTTPQGKLVTEKMIEQHNKHRVNKEAIQKMIDHHIDYQFKPVCNPVTQPEMWDEIEAFRVEMNIPKNKTWIMPPGGTAEEIMKALPDVIDFCGKNNYNFSGRDHILAFGPTRQK